MGINGMTLLSGVQGFQDGQDRAEAREMRKYGMDRQVSADARQAKLDAQQDEDRARALEQDQKYGEPQRQAQLKALQDNESERAKMEALDQAYRSGDPKAAEAVYNNLVPDGYQGTITKVADDLYEMTTPRGKVQATWDQLYFGNPEKAGIGLFHLVNPGGAFKRAQETQAAKDKVAQEIASEKRGHDYRMQEIGAGAAATRANSMLTQGEPFKGDDGNMYILRPDGSVQPVMHNGAPMAAPKYGMGLPRAGAGGPDYLFGNSSKMQELSAKVKILAASDKTGQLKAVLEQEDGPAQIAAMVLEFEKAGADRTARMKLARDMVKQSASGAGEYMTPEEVAARAESLLHVVDQLAGPAPSMPGTQAQEAGGGDAMPSPGDVVDGYRYKGGDPNSQDSWEPVQ